MDSRCRASQKRRPARPPIRSPARRAILAPDCRSRDARYFGPRGHPVFGLEKTTRAAEPARTMRRYRRACRSSGKRLRRTQDLRIRRLLRGQARVREDALRVASTQHRARPRRYIHRQTFLAEKSGRPRLPRRNDRSAVPRLRRHAMPLPCSRGVNADALVVAHASADHDVRCVGAACLDDHGIVEHELCRNEASRQVTVRPTSVRSRMMKRPDLLHRTCRKRWRGTDTRTDVSCDAETRERENQDSQTSDHGNLPTPAGERRSVGTTLERCRELAKTDLSVISVE